MQCLFVQKQPTDLFGEKRVRFFQERVKYLRFTQFFRTDHFSRRLPILPENPYFLSPNRSFFQEAPNFDRKLLIFVPNTFSMQIIVLINAPNRSYSQSCPISRGNYFTEHVFCHFTEQIEQNFFEQISFTGSLKKQLVQPKLSVRTDRFHRMTNFWISLKTGTEQIVFPGEKQTPNTFFTEQIRWLLSFVLFFRPKDH